MYESQGIHEFLSVCMMIGGSCRKRRVRIQEVFTVVDCSNYSNVVVPVGVVGGLERNHRQLERVKRGGRHLVGFE